MNYLFKMALKNVLRNRKRTILTLISISFGIFILVISRAMMDGIDEESTRNFISYQTAHMKVFSQGYFEDVESMPLDKLIYNPAALEEEIRKNKNVEATTNRVEFAITISNGADELNCLGLGLDVERDKGVFILNQMELDGNYLEPDDDGVIIGKRLAREFGLVTGDWVTVMGWTTEESINALDFEIKGIFKSSNPMLDGNVVIMPLKTADEFLVLDGGVTEIDVKLKRNKNLEKVQKAILATVNESGKKYEVITWKKLAEDIIAFITVKKAGSDAAGIIILIIAAVGIINTILMSVFERVKEIGMMMAMGMKGKEIRKLFLLEGSVIGLLGSAIGTLMGVAVTLAFSGGMDFSSFGDAMSDQFGVEAIIYPTLSLDMITIYFILGVGLSVLASIYPAIKASRFEPVEALRK